MNSSISSSARVGAVALPTTLMSTLPKHLLNRFEPQRVLVE